MLHTIETEVSEIIGQALILVYSCVRDCSGILLFFFANMKPTLETFYDVVVSCLVQKRLKTKDIAESPTQRVTSKQLNFLLKILLIIVNGLSKKGKFYEQKSVFLHFLNTIIIYLK
jgi:hypothetical protein